MNTDNTPTNDDDAATEKVDYVASLRDALIAFATDHDTDALQTAYRSVPSAARGKVQSAAMVDAIGAGLSGDDIGAAVTAMASMPSATPTRRTRDPLSADAVGAIRRYAVADAMGMTVEDRVTYIVDELRADYADVIDAAVNAMRRAIDNVNIGTGTRTHVAVGLSDMIDAGVIPDGADIIASNGTHATVTRSGVTVNGETYSVSAAACAVLNVKSVNGWEKFTYNGRTLHALRADVA